MHCGGFIVFRAPVNKGSVIASLHRCLLCLLNGHCTGPAGFSAILGVMSCCSTVVAVSFCWLRGIGSVPSILMLSLTSVSLGAAQVHWYWLVIVGSWGSSGIVRGPWQGCLS